MKSISIFLLIFSIQLFARTNDIPSTKIKNLVTIKGVRSNPLIGYGVVVGLNGTGDSTTNLTLQDILVVYVFNVDKILFDNMSNSQLY